MKQTMISRASLGRLPEYLKYLKSVQNNNENISATTIAKNLGLGEVQVRKDLSAISGDGKPRVGYNTCDLIASIEKTLGYNDISKAIMIGAGKLGTALLDYEGFREYGLEVIAAFDADPKKIGTSNSGKKIYSINCINQFLENTNIDIGIIAVPKSAAQDICDKLVEKGIKAIWNFSPVQLILPPNIVIRNENLALSFAHLKNQIYSIKEEKGE